jgi:hypothetical protein
MSGNVDIPMSMDELNELNSELYKVFQIIKDITDDTPVEIDDFDYITTVKNIIESRKL